MIYVLAISLLIIFIISFILNKKDIVSPSFIFSFGFVFQSIWAVVYAKKWENQQHNIVCKTMAFVKKAMQKLESHQAIFHLTI